MDKTIYLFIYFVAVYITGIWCKNVYPELQGDNGNKIVGGEETTIKSYPYQAHLKLDLGDDNVNYCGGTIVTEYFIITAAHCLAGTQYMLVRIGSSDYNFGGIEYNSTVYNLHPSFNPDTYDYDIGIITIREGMDFKRSAAKPVAIASGVNDPEENEVMLISGWGNIKEGGDFSNTLRVAEVPVVRRQVCNEQLQGGITTRMFCAGYIKGGIDTCQGDSGGPAVSRKTGRLAGVTSYGFGCARPQTPGVYTRIGHLGVKMYITMKTGLF